jgi:hypothetical protein
MEWQVAVAVFSDRNVRVWTHGASGVTNRLGRLLQRGNHERLRIRQLTKRWQLHALVDLGVHLRQLLVWHRSGG